MKNTAKKANSEQTTQTAPVTPGATIPPSTARSEGAPDSGVHRKADLARKEEIIEEYFVEADRQLDILGKYLEEVADGDVRTYAINSARSCLLQARGNMRDAREEVRIMAYEARV